MYTVKSILNDNTCNVAAQPASQITNNTNNDSISVGDFFAKRRGDVLKPRRNISSVIAGKAITEIDVSENIEEYQLETAKKKNKPNGSKIKKNCKSKSNKKQSNNEQQPGPSKENTKVVNFYNCDIWRRQHSRREVLCLW